MLCRIIMEMLDEVVAVFSPVFEMGAKMQYLECLPFVVDGAMMDAL